MPILNNPENTIVVMGNLDVGFAVRKTELFACVKLEEFLVPQKSRDLDYRPTSKDYADNSVILAFPANDPECLDSVIAALQKFKLFAYGGMVYTVGKKAQYNSFIKNDENASKLAGGSVWRTVAEAREHTDEAGTYDIYGVIADWDNDTEVVPGQTWRSLKKTCKLVRI